MNKPTREQIEHRAIELMLEETMKSSCEFCDQNDPMGNCFEGSCRISLMKTALRKAEEELTPHTYFATKEYHEEFIKRVKALEQVTGHEYTHFELRINCPGHTVLRHMRFYWDGEIYDSVAGWWWQLIGQLQKEQRYSIEELLKNEIGNNY